MKKLHTQEQIDEMRKRLYDRGEASEQAERHQLSDVKVDVSRDWAVTPKQERRSRTNKSDLRTGAVVEQAPLPQQQESVPTQEQTPMQTASSDIVALEDKPSRGYRKFVLLGSLLIFIFVAAISSVYLYLGGNQISTHNVQIAINGPAVIGGGEVVQLQIGISNQNSVTMESGSLILKYPEGTQSAGDSPRILYEDRIPVDDIAPGETRNVPVRVVVFGDEQALKTIEATIEYRVDGTNSTLHNDAEPLAIRISSSPLVLRIESVEKVASGQLVDVIMTAVSNASTPLKDILITASYPNGFEFENSNPAPVFGENVWRIDEILPEEEIEIKLQGIVRGLTEETFRINFSAGHPNPDNQYLLGSTLAEAKKDFFIERPFIDVEIAINNDTDRDVIIPQGKKSDVQLGITNTLDETVYDMVVEVVTSGNALTESSIESDNGFYDSNSGTVRWEVSNNESFSQVLPGDRRTLEFEVNQGPNLATASFDMVVNVYARRVDESSASETLIGTIKAEAKYSAEIIVGAQAGRNVGRFSDNGPIPPEVGETTSYTLSLVAEAGANDMTGAVVKTSLPVYVNWLDQYDSDGTVTYNSVSKELEWDIGDISMGDRKQFIFQVSMKPSVSQLDSIPVLLNKQLIRVNDRFTGALLQDDSPAVTTELSEEMGFSEGNGFVIQ